MKRKIVKKFNLLILIGILILLSACQSAGNPPTSSASSIRIDSQSLLFENTGLNETLTATVLDKNGKVISEKVTWESSKPDVVSISTD
jgi:hypothetical protein